MGTCFLRASLAVEGRDNLLGHAIAFLVRLILVHRLAYKLWQCILNPTEKIPPVKINPLKKCSCTFFFLQPLFFFSQHHPKVFLHRGVDFTVAPTEVCFPSSVFQEVSWSIKDKVPYLLRYFPSWLPRIWSFVVSQRTFTQKLT